MAEAEITDEQKETIIGCFDKIFEAYKQLKDKELDEEEAKKRDKVCKRMLTRTHLLLLIPLAVDNTISINDIAEFCNKFFSGSKTTTNEVYNANASRGTGRAESVNNRIREIKKSYSEFVSRRAYAPTTNENEVNTENVDIDEDALRVCVSDIMGMTA